MSYKGFVWLNRIQQSRDSHFWDKVEDDSERGHGVWVTTNIISHLLMTDWFTSRRVGSGFSFWDPTLYIFSLRFSSS